MSSKISLVVPAAVAMALVSAPIAVASDRTDNRDLGPNAHDTELDQEYARTHPTVVPGTPPTLNTPYGYVPPHHPIHKKHR